MDSRPVPPANREEAEREIAHLRAEMARLGRLHYSLIATGLGIAFLVGALAYPGDRLMLEGLAALALGVATAGWTGLLRFPYPARWAPPLAERIAFLEGFLADRTATPAQDAEGPRDH